MAEQQSPPSEASTDDVRHEKQKNDDEAITASAAVAGIESKDQPISPEAVQEAADPSSASEPKKLNDNGNGEDNALDDGQSAEANSKPTSPAESADHDTIGKSSTALEDKSEHVDGITESAASLSEIALESNDSPSKNLSADKNDKIESVAESVDCETTTPLAPQESTDQKSSPKEKITTVEQQPVVDKVKKTGAAAAAASASPQEEELALSAEKSTLPADETQPLPERVALWVEKAATSKAINENKDSGIDDNDNNKAIALDHDESEAQLQIDEKEEEEPCEITKRRHSSGTSASSDSQKSQKAATHIVRRSIRCSSSSLEMPQCAVATCRNSHRRTRGRRIRYHRFPQIPEVRQRWVRACGRPPLSNGDIPFNIQTARICSLHFTNDSYEKDMEHLVLGLPVRSRLRRGAVPTIGVPVNVQPVTKMLVEDAKRSLLKQAAANARSNSKQQQQQQQQQQQLHAQKSQQQQQQQAKKSQRLIGKADSATADLHAGYDVLLALGLTPATNLNKMHTLDGDEKKAQDSPVDLKQCAADAEQELNNKSPKMPQSQQNGAALPEEAASAERLIGNVTLKKEPRDSSYDAGKQHSQQSSQAKSTKMHAEQSKLGRPSTGQQQQRGISTKSSLYDDQQHYHHQQQPLTSPYRETRKRRSLESSCHAVLSANGSPSPKKFCTDQREQYINSLIGSDKFNAEQLAARADQLRAEVQDLDELARAKEMEWNEILSMRKLKEEAYLRIERRRQIMGYMESNGNDTALPLASLSLTLQHQQLQQQQQQQEMKKEDRHSRTSSKVTANYHPPNKQQHHHQQQQQHQQLLENGPKQQQQHQLLDLQNSEQNRQIGEGRQGAIVDVRSIIADYRLRHPAETVPKRSVRNYRDSSSCMSQQFSNSSQQLVTAASPRDYSYSRGRRMRNSVNVGLGAGGAMVETLGNMDSRPSSTDSCKSNTNNLIDPNTTMSFKDVLVQFAKLSQQQGEPIKTPQNYPDVTLHPVVPTPTTAAVTSSQSSNPPSSGSLLHGILTKSQSPRPTTFSPTLARLLTAPERERNASANMSNLQPSNAHLAHAYQGANPVSISNFLSSSKARTEITITPVVNNLSQSQANNLIHVDDGDDEVIEEKDNRLSMGSRDNKEDRDAPPRCQGCHERTAQFVCAGCGNQWYCSRECQVAAWDDHSEVCSG